MTDKIITGINTNEQLIKKSLFVGICAKVTSNAEFSAFLTTYQDLNATHNCWAYRIGNEYRFNDDGEPSGTAGKPMLAAIDGAGFNNLAALVIRYYGGIKLGTGGLARAYGGTTAKNLQSADHTYHIPMLRINLQLPFEFAQALFSLCEEHKGKILQQDYHPQGVNFKISIPKQCFAKFKSTLTNISKGQVSFLK